MIAWSLRSKVEVLGSLFPLLRRRQQLIWSQDRPTKNERRKRRGKRKRLSTQRSSSSLTSKISRHRKKESHSVSQDLKNLLQLTRAWTHLLRLS